MLDLGSPLEEGVLIGIVIGEIIDKEGAPFDGLAVDLNAEALRRHRAIARGEREVVIIEAARRKDRRESKPRLIVDEPKAVIFFFVAADKRLDTDTLKEGGRLKFAEGKARALLLKRGRDHIGRARIAPHHLEADVFIVQRREIDPALLQQPIARDPAMNEEGLPEKEHIRERLEDLAIMTEDVDIEMRLQRIDRLGGLHAAKDPAFIFDIIFVVPAEEEDMLGRREEKL